MTGSLTYQCLPNAPVQDAHLLLLPVAYGESVSGRQGTADAPSAILAASEQLEYHEEGRSWSPMKYLKVAVLPTFRSEPSEPEAGFHDRLGRSVEALPRCCESPPAQQRLLVVLGGEHSITPSVTEHRLPTGTVVFLDAHADLRSTYRGSRFNHACPVSRLREQGHRVIMVGTRSIFEREAERIATDPDIEMFSARALRSTLVPVLARLRQLRGPVWLSIDMDVFDPSVVPSVGTPQPGGLDFYSVVDMVEALVDNPVVQLHGADFVELIPEPSQVSQVTAAKLLQKLISHWGCARGARQWAPHGSQADVDYE